jgi:hypothetical protein
MISVSSSGKIKEVEGSTGILVANPYGPTCTVENLGVVELIEGNNVTIEEQSQGVYKINSTAVSSGLDSITGGTGIQVMNGSGPTATIENVGVVSLVNGDNTFVNALGNGVFSIDAPGISGVTQGIGINVTYPNGVNPTVSNAGVVSLVGGTSTSVQNLGNGVWKTNLTGGVSQITSGTGINVTNGSGPIVSVSNTGILSLTNGTNTQVSTTAQGVWKVDANVPGVSQINAGSGISVANSTGPTTTVSNSGVISMIAGSNTTVQSMGSGVWKVNAVAAQSTYTVKVTSDNAIVTVPANCQYVDVMVIGQGGRAGTSIWPSSYGQTYSSGGSGGGGGMCCLKKMLVRQNQLFKFDYNNNNTGGNDYCRLYYTDDGSNPNPTSSSTFTLMCEAYSGGDGGNASSSSAGSKGGRSPTAYTNSAFGTWTIVNGEYGHDGYRNTAQNPTTTPIVPDFGGYPLFRAYVNAETGCGQTYINTGSGVAGQPATTNRGGGTAYVTFYLS